MRKIVAIAVFAFVTGAIVGGVVGGSVAGVSAQLQRPRWEVDRQTGFMFIRDTRTSTCYLAVDGGGIIQSTCPF